MTDLRKTIQPNPKPTTVTQEGFQSVQAAIAPNTPTSAAAVVDLLATLPADFMHEGRDDSPPQTRESL